MVDQFVGKALDGWIETLRGFNCHTARIVYPSRGGEVSLQINVSELLSDLEAIKISLAHPVLAMSAGPQGPK